MRTLGMDKDELEYFMSLVLEGFKKNVGTIGKKLLRIKKKKYE